MKEEYSWKIEGLAKRVDPSLAAEELQKLQNIYGSITPELLVNEAKKKKSPLHPMFEWDDTEAARKYRLQQARTILNNIQVKIIADGEPRQISVYEVTSFKEGYKSFNTFTSDDIEYVKLGIERSLFELKRKLSLYKQFDKVLEYVNQAIESLY